MNPIKIYKQFLLCFCILEIVCIFFMPRNLFCFEQNLEEDLLRTCCKITDFIFKYDKKATGKDKIKCDGTLNDFLESIKKRPKTNNLVGKTITEIILKKGTKTIDIDFLKLFNESVTAKIKSDTLYSIHFSEIEPILKHPPNQNISDKDSSKKNTSPVSPDINATEKKTSIHENRESGFIGSDLFFILLVLLAVCLLIFIGIFLTRGTNTPATIIKDKGNKTNNSDFAKETLEQDPDTTKGTENSDKIKLERSEIEKTGREEYQEVINETPEKKIDIWTRSKEEDNQKIYLTGVSVIGKSHIKSKTPCQDYFDFKMINEFWGICVVCDGAGSANNSHHGSKFVVNVTITEFENVIRANDWIEKKMLPDRKDWETIAFDSMRKIRDNLNRFADSLNAPFGSLACTVIVLIYSPCGLLLSHIGDGRAGYQNFDGKWKPAMIPHKGDEANETIFITSKMGNAPLLLKGISIPESVVISEKVKSFVLMSDGCEMHSYLCSEMDYENNKWTDPNLPFDKFFNPVVEMLKNGNVDNKRSKILTDILKFGTDKLKTEPDDKTMVIGIINF